MQIVNIHEAKTHLSRLLKEVKDGKGIIIGKAGKPIARLIMFDEPGPRKPGILKGKLSESFFEPLPYEELKECQ